MKYSGEKKNKEKQKNEGSAPGLSLLSSKTIFAKLNISSTSCGLMLLMTESFLFYTSGSLSDCVFFFFFNIIFNRCVLDIQPCPNNDIINDTKIL